MRVFTVYQHTLRVIMGIVYIGRVFTVYQHILGGFIMVYIHYEDFKGISAYISRVYVG
jgi:hypothetical protein